MRGQRRRGREKLRSDLVPDLGRDLAPHDRAEAHQGALRLRQQVGDLDGRLGILRQGNFFEGHAMT